MKEITPGQIVDFKGSTYEVLGLNPKSSTKEFVLVNVVTNEIIITYNLVNK